MKKQNENEELELDQALGASEQFLMKNQKTILISLAAIVIVVCAVLGIKNGIIEPKNEEAQAELAACQRYFAMDSINIALNGDNNECIGFVGVMDEYAHTKAGKLAKAYAGLCYAQLGQDEEALECLKGFSTDEENADEALKIKTADCYVNLDQNEDAVKLYKKVADAKHDVYSPVALHKLGIIYEAEGNKEEALAAYEAIKEEYPNSMEAQDVDKYIARLK